MYRIPPGRYRRHGGCPLLHDNHPLFDNSSFGAFGGLESWNTSWNTGWNSQSIDESNKIEQATRRHVDAQREYEHAKEKFEEAKKKLEDCEKRLKEAERILSYAKHRTSAW
jgi:hypothetical protein